MALIETVRDTRLSDARAHMRRFEVFLVAVAKKLSLEVGHKFRYVSMGNDPDAMPDDVFLGVEERVGFLRWRPCLDVAGFQNGAWDIGVRVDHPPVLERIVSECAEAFDVDVRLTIL